MKRTDKVREAIIQLVETGVLQPDDLVDETELATRFCTSSTPVREAILQLEAIGLIERKPRHGPRIVAPNIEDLLSMIEVHTELEGFAARCAARRITTQQANDLLATLQQCEQQGLHPYASADEYYKVNMAFHRAVYAAANNHEITHIVETTGIRLLSYFRARHHLAHGIQRSVEEHRAIAEAILDKDGGRAYEQMTKHVTLDSMTALDVVSWLRSNQSH